LEKKKPISTLGKWLPSEGSKINKKINFIDKFNSLIWGNSKLSKFTLRKKYRQLKTHLNEELGTLESLMATKQLDKIDLKKVSIYSLNRHKHHLLENSEVMTKYNEFQTQRLSKLNLFDFVKELDTNNVDTNTLQQVWDTQNYHMLIPYLNQVITNSICIIDMSKEMFTNNAHYLSIGIGLLVNKMSIVEDNIIVGKDIVKFNDDMTLVEKKNQILKFSGPCGYINVDYYKKLINKDDCIMIFVTNKNIKYPPTGKYIQVTPYFDNNYDIMVIENNKCRKITKYDVNDSTREVVQDIINSRPELQDMSYIYYILMLVFVWTILKFIETIIGPKIFIMNTL
jgi:hypothetical protein